MASKLNLAYQNFMWRLEKITPTSTICGKGFQRLDPKQLATDESSGLERSFILTWLGSGDDLEPSDGQTHDAEHKFLLQVIYFPGRGYELTHELILNDRWDIMKAIGDPASFVGYDDNHPVDELRQFARERERDEVDISDPNVWLFRQFWTVRIVEEES